MSAEVFLENFGCTENWKVAQHEDVLCMKSYGFLTVVMNLRKEKHDVQQVNNNHERKEHIYLET